MTETDLSTWLPITDAAQHIGCSTRTIARLARAGKLEQRLRPQAGSPAVAVYNPDDVARIASERRPGPAPFVLPAGSASNGNGRPHTPTSTHIQTGPPAVPWPSTDDPIRQLFAAALRAVLSPPSPPVVGNVAETTLYLTIAEAAAVSGLSQAYLRRKCQSGWQAAFKDGAWKIRRKDLEAL
jgi:hypothetical protein